MEEETSENILRFKFNSNLERLSKITNTGGGVLWMTGLSGSGKSTIADALKVKLIDFNVNSFVLDGDDVRSGLCKDLSFSLEDREENIRRVAEVARLLSRNANLVLCCFISPTKKVRELARKIIQDNFFEIYIKSEVEQCIKRDPKGLYKKALIGEITNFTGINSEYDVPISPDLTLDTNDYSIDQSVFRIIEFLKEKNLLK